VPIHYPRPVKTPAPPGKLPRALKGRPSITVLALALAGALVAGIGAVTASSAQADTELVVQAESYTAQSGAQLENTADTGGGQNVGWLASNDWMSYANIDLGTTGSLTSKVRVSSANSAGGTLELRADSLGGTVLASYTIKATGNWQSWITQTVTTMPMVTGKHTVFISLHSPQPADFVNVNWFSFSTPAGSTPMPSMTPTPTATMTMPPGTPMPTMTATPAPTGGWVSVDPVKQAADTKAFFALTPAPITNNPVRVPEFHASCAANHHLSDDPIVFPGQSGASHNHTFMGNTTTDANSTLESLKAGTTNCDPAGDKSAYWIPTLYANGKVVDPASTVTVYYGSRLKDPSKTQPFPEGFRMIAGDAKKQVDTADKQGNHFWCAGIGGEVGRTADGLMPICAPTANLNYQLVFADCWDGVHLDSPDHKSHVSNGENGGCPAAFPVPIPNVSFVIAWPQGMDTTNVTLSSGTTFSMHGDFFNAWDPAALAARVRTCINQSAKCNAAGGF
jgi:hypothetical protein